MGIENGVSERSLSAVEIKNMGFEVLRHLGETNNLPGLISAQEGLQKLLEAVNEEGK